MGYRNKLIRIFTFLGGIYFFLEFVIPSTPNFQFDKYHEQISTYFIAVGVMAVGLGLINLLLVHGSKIIFLRKGWINSSALLIGLFLMLAITLLDWGASEKISGAASKYFSLRDFTEVIEQDASKNRTDVPSFETRISALENDFNALKSEDEVELGLLRERLDFSDITLLRVKNLTRDFETYSADANTSIETLAANGKGDAEEFSKLSFSLSELGKVRGSFKSIDYDHSNTKHWYDFLFYGLFVPLGSAMFSLLGFYIAAAAYRAFRVRSAESALMMIAAILVMLGQIPFGLWIWEGFPELRSWILKVPNAAAFRAIDIGAQVALLIMAFRMWLSIESESFSKREEES